VGQMLNREGKVARECGNATLTRRKTGKVSNVKSPVLILAHHTLTSHA